MTITTGIHDRSKNRKQISPLRRAVCVNLRQFREMAGWSQTYVAGLLKMSQPSYNAIERGRDDIRLQTLEKLAKIFHTDVRAFLAPVAEMNTSATKKKKTKKSA